MGISMERGTLRSSWNRLICSLVMLSSFHETSMMDQGLTISEWLRNFRKLWLLMVLSSRMGTMKNISIRMIFSLHSVEQGLLSWIIERSRSMEWTSSEWLTTPQRQHQVSKILLIRSDWRQGSRQYFSNTSQLCIQHSRNIRSISSSQGIRIVGRCGHFLTYQRSSMGNMSMGWI